MSKWTSPTKIRRKQRLNCVRKVPYNSLAEAQLVADHMINIGKASNVVQPYKCPNCGKFHWGHPTGLNGGVGSGNSHVQSSKSVI